MYMAQAQTLFAFLFYFLKDSLSLCLDKATKLTELLSPWVCIINFNSQILMYRRHRLYF